MLSADFFKFAFQNLNFPLLIWYQLVRYKFKECLPCISYSLDKSIFLYRLSCLSISYNFNLWKKIQTKLWNSVEQQRNAWKPIIILGTRTHLFLGTERAILLFPHFLLPLSIWCNKSTKLLWDFDILFVDLKIIFLIIIEYLHFNW